jgi:hypothetical protein
MEEVNYVQKIYKIYLPYPTWRKDKLLGVGIFPMEPFKYPSDLWN